MKHVSTRRANPGNIGVTRNTGRPISAELIAETPVATVRTARSMK